MPIISEMGDGRQRRPPGSPLLYRVQLQAIEIPYLQQKADSL